jgi:hypothetical protein
MTETAHRPDPGTAPPLVFGIYPGMTGLELPQGNVYVGPVPDDPERTRQALALLQPAGQLFLVRSYLVYAGSGRSKNLTPDQPERYAQDGRRLDLVACYRSEEGDLDDWTRFVRATVRVTEHGWPTGPGRSADRQADSITTVVRAIHRRRAELNITHYEFVMLRDGNSERPEMGAQFGLLRHDYVPKPGFEAYRRLIAELGT